MPTAKEYFELGELAQKAGDAKSADYYNRRAVEEADKGNFGDSEPIEYENAASKGINQPSQAKAPRLPEAAWQATKEVGRGAWRGLEKQAVGLSQLLTEVLPQPRSRDEYIKKLYERGRSLKEETQAGTGYESAGEALPAIAEFGFAGVPKTIAGRVGANALTGGLYAAMQPYGSPSERLDASLQGAALNVALPLAGEAFGGVRNIFNTRYRSAKKLREGLAEVMGKELPMPELPAFRYGKSAELDWTDNPIGKGRRIDEYRPGPVGPNKPGVEGARPTAGMLAQQLGSEGTPVVALEYAQRLTPKGGSLLRDRDAENYAAMWESLNKRAVDAGERGTMQDTLWNATQGTREAAIRAARAHDDLTLGLEPMSPKPKTRIPTYAQELNQKLEEIQNTPGLRSEDFAQKLASKGFKRINPKKGDPPYISPEDMISYRTTLGDFLDVPPGMTPSKEQKAVFSNRGRPLAVQLRNAISEGLDRTTDGKYSLFNKQYIEGLEDQGIQGMKEITSRYRLGTIQEALGRGRSTWNLDSQGNNVPIITEFQLKRLEKNALRNAGKSGDVSAFIPEDKALYNDMIGIAAAIDNVRGGPQAVSGSQTASNLARIMAKGSDQGLTSKAVSRLADTKTLGFASGLYENMLRLGKTKMDDYLNDLILNPTPEKWAKFREAYNSATQPFAGKKTKAAQGLAAYYFGRD